jgi:hypothetical protein
MLKERSVCLCGERVVQGSPLCHVRVLKEMTEWLPGNYEIALKKKKVSKALMQSAVCINK